MSGGSARSLGKGSAPPGPVPEGLIRVYSMRFCPYAQRTRLVLTAKGIRHEVININLKNKPEWFFKKNPSGLVPVLETSQGQLICESAITCEYLDEAYPEKKLLPGDPYEKACQKMVFESFSKVPPLISGIVRTQNKEDCSGLKEELRKEITKLEEVLTAKKTTFFGGNSLSMIDYLIWPWFERLEALELNECVDHTPALKLWMAAMKKDPTVSSLLTDVKTFQGFFNLYLQNSPEASAVLDHFPTTPPRPCCSKVVFGASGARRNAAVLGPCAGGSKPYGKECERWSLRRRRESMTDDATRTLGKGSIPPGPVPEGIIRLYSMRFCPYAHRTRLVLRAKGIRHEVININLRNKPEWYFTKHPFGQIPVLENSKCQLIYESVIACEYLDDAYPGRKLYPYDPYERARQKMLLELFYKILGYQNTVFFGGDCISMIDYLFWPWFERLDVYGIADCVNHTPALRLWIAAMKQDPTVCSLLTDKNTFLGFLNLYFQNNPGAFDYGLSC
ncbi:hypothetical protein MJT46_018332 [Ovis ammon polii x Ovis aries]|nr:hypothetical protein MJT46_018332 [Ovis ammon polii x Ovis aries]